MRFLRRGTSDPGPDGDTIWTFREVLTRALIESKPAIRVLFCAFEIELCETGFLARGGHIAGATVVAAPNQHKPKAEKLDLPAGRILNPWKA